MFHLTIYKCSDSKFGSKIACLSLSFTFYASEHVAFRHWQPKTLIINGSFRPSFNVSTLYEPY